MELKEVSRSELVEKYILEHIIAGLKPGSRIASERELAKMVGVSVPTVNKILVSLTDRGILFRRKGLGTYVAEKTLSGKVVRVITQSMKTYDPLATVNWFNYQFVLEGFFPEGPGVRNHCGDLFFRSVPARDTGTAEGTASAGSGRLSVSHGPEKRLGVGARTEESRQNRNCPKLCTFGYLPYGLCRIEGKLY